MTSGSSARAKAQAFKEEVEAKIRNLIEEFADGKISREQFHIIYERYNAQLQIANHAMLSGNPDAVSIAQSGPPTINIREAHMARAMGLMIYHNRSGRVLETLGEFSVEVAKIAPVLNNITQAMESGQFIERRVEKMADKLWLMFAAGDTTTVITEFLNQPSEQQMREIERLHHDFEQANIQILGKETIQTDKLAYPFLVFIRKKVSR